MRQSLALSHPSTLHFRFYSCIGRQPTPVAARWSLSDLSFKRCIGEGSAGKILLAEVDSMCIAVKSISKKSEKVARIADAEKTVLSLVRHPLIVTYYGCIEDQNRVYLLLEYLANGDLFHLLQRKRLKQADVRFVAMEVVAILAYLHSENIVYRDLKPENVMIHQSGHVRLIDFGFAKRMEGEKTRSVLGSPEYMAPEMVLRRPHGFAVDCWSLGVLLYELHVCHPPFEGDSPMSVYESILRSAYDLPPSLSPQTKDLIRRLLVPEPKLRMKIEEVATHAFFADIDWVRAQKGEATPPDWELLAERKKEEFRTDLFD